MHKDLGCSILHVYAIKYYLPGHNFPLWSWDASQASSFSTELHDSSATQLLIELKCQLMVNSFTAILCLCLVQMFQWAYLHTLSLFYFTSSFCWHAFSMHFDFTSKHVVKIYKSMFYICFQGYTFVHFNYNNCMLSLANANGSIKQYGSNVYYWSP